MNQPKLLVYIKSFFVVSFLVFSGCSDDIQQSLKAVPTAFGKINEIVVIADKEVWEGPIGDTLEFYYSSAYPILPQPEPIFDLRHFTPEDLERDPMRKELRNYFFVADLNDPNSPTTKLISRDIGEEKARRAKEDPSFNSTVGRDKWAKGQIIVYQFGYTEDALIENLKKNFPAIKKKFNDADKDKIDATVYLDGVNHQLMEEVTGKMGVSIRVPSDYFLAKSDGEIIWMRKETQVLSSNLILKKIPYTDKSQLTKDGIKAICDEIGKRYISSQLPNTYLRVNDIDLPLLTQVTSIDNKYTLEARGIWEIVNDYMGGAFVAYLIHHPEKNELLFVEGFIHAPGEDKRDFMQQLEYVMSTVRF